MICLNFTCKGLYPLKSEVFWSAFAPLGIKKSSGTSLQRSCKGFNINYIHAYVVLCVQIFFVGIVG